MEFTYCLLVRPVQEAYKDLPCRVAALSCWPAKIRARRNVALVTRPCVWPPKRQPSTQCLDFHNSPPRYFSDYQLLPIAHVHRCRTYIGMALGIRALLFPNHKLHAAWLPPCQSCSAIHMISCYWMHKLSWMGAMTMPWVLAICFVSMQSLLRIDAAAMVQLALR